MSLWKALTSAPVRGVCLTVMLLAACIATDDAARYEHDGVRYGVTEGPFRGRWWNYYERGRSFLEGGFYAEAEADFRAALTGRERDSLWPRTYGLHVIPEYFPHRELGVAHFYQDRLEESAAQLERSLSQQHTARAAFYLGEVRRKQTETRGGDVVLPSIEIIAPKGDVPVGATRVQVEGVVRDNGYVAAIRVGAQPFDVAVCALEVAFTKEVTVGPGQNEVPVTAVDLTGNATTVHVPIDADVDGPAVSFDTPVVVPGVIRGLAMDRSGIGSLQVSGRAAAISAQADNLVSFAIELPPDALQPPIRFACTDMLGNVTEGTLPVDAAARQARHADILFASGVRSVEGLPGGLRGWLVNGQLVAVAAEPQTGLSVEMPEIQEGDQYFEDEIVIALAVRSDAAIAEIALNGQPIETIPGRTETRVTRRLRLERGPNELHAHAMDAAGRAAEDRKTILREQTEIELDSAKLAVAFLRAETRTVNAELAEDAVTVLDMLGAIPVVAERFRIVDRALLEPVLAEQELSGYLASPENRIALNQLTAAEALFTARVRRDAESVEIVLNGASTETGEQIATFIDVAGPYSEMARLIEDLGYRLVQAFPRPTGTVWNWDAPEVECDLNRSHRIRPSMKCIVFRTEERIHPVTGQPTGSFRPRIIGQGIIEGVGAEFSTARVLAGVEDEDVAAYPIEAGQYVVIK